MAQPSAQLGVPDLVVVGAPRSGTTSLHHYLAQHPGIAMSSVKEPNFFLFDGPGDRDRPLIDEPTIVAKSVSDPDDYRALFADATPGQVTAEISVLYLYTEATPRLLAATSDRVRAAMVLRHPVDRAYSHFLYTYTGPAETVRTEFREACEREAGLPDTPFRSGTHLLRLGRYGPQIDRYLDALGPDRVLITLYDDLQEDPAGFLRRFCGFAGVDDGFAFDTATTYNGSALRGRATRLVTQGVGRAGSTVKRVLPAPVAGRLGHLRARLRRPGAAPPLGESFREELAATFEDSTRRVEELTGRSLPHWRH